MRAELSVQLLPNSQGDSSTFCSHQQVHEQHLSVHEQQHAEKNYISQANVTNKPMFFLHGQLAHPSGKKVLSLLQGSKLGSYIRVTGLPDHWQQSYLGHKDCKMHVHLLSQQAMPLELKEWCNGNL